MELSVTKLILILVIVLVLFGRGKIPGLMGDIGKGIRSLKEGLKSDDKKPEEPKQIVSEDKENKL